MPTHAAEPREVNLKVVKYQSHGSEVDCERVDNECMHNLHQSLHSGSAVRTAQFLPQGSSPEDRQQGYRDLNDLGNAISVVLRYERQGEEE